MDKTERKKGKTKINSQTQFGYPKTEKLFIFVSRRGRKKKKKI